MVVTLSYVRSDGLESEHEFDPGLDILDLTKREISSIDLSPLSEFVALKRVLLGENAIQSIDLTPLSRCDSLELLSLSSNQLQKIDLRPLSKCRGLRQLTAVKNQLRSIDLKPLAPCKELVSLYLSENQLETVNLSWLAESERLYYLVLANNPIEKIDLSPLSNLLRLGYLNLSLMQLKRIDLAPLSTCEGLNHLDLTKNLLEEIDIAPLSECKNLERLHLGANRLESIDLSPLTSCPQFHELHLHMNRLEQIDFTQLARCRRLNYISYTGNRFRRLDVAPLIALEPAGYMLEKSFRKKDETEALSIHSWLRGFRGDVVYLRPDRTYPWWMLSSVIRRFAGNCLVEQDILSAMGLGDYGFIDLPLGDVLQSFPPETSLERIRDELIPILVKQIVDGHSSTGMNLDSIAAANGEVAVMAKRIIRARERELSRVRVGVNNDAVNLTELHLTAYGHEILRALELRLETDLETLKIVGAAFEELGYEFETAEEPVSGVKMSDNLREAILWIAENRGRPWDEILR